MTTKNINKIKNSNSNKKIKHNNNSENNIFNQKKSISDIQKNSKIDQKVLQNSIDTVTKKINKKYRRKIILLSTLLPLASIGATIGVYFGIKSCTNRQQEEDIKIEYIDIPIDQEYVPTIKPTETIYSKDSSGAQKATEDYFGSSQAQTVIKEDVSGYLKGYVDEWKDISKAKVWLKENYPDFYKWLQEQLDDPSLLDVDQIIAATLGSSDIQLVPEISTQGKIVAYKLSARIQLGCKIKLIDAQTGGTGKEYGYIELGMQLDAKNIPYTIYYSNNNTWSAGIQNLDKYTDWSIHPILAGKIINTDTGSEIEFKDKELPTFTEVPPSSSEYYQIFQTIRKCMQWDCAFLSKSN